MSEHTKAVTDAAFASDVLQSTTPVLVDFWAEWCGPCRALAPALDTVAGALAGKVTVAKVNIDENPAAPTQYGVRSIPTLMLFKDGKVVATKVGGLPAADLQRWIESNI